MFIYAWSQNFRYVFLRCPFNYYIPESVNKVIVQIELEAISKWYRLSLKSSPTASLSSSNLMLGREQILRLVVAEGKGVLLDFLYLAYIIPATVTHFLSGIAGPINKPWNTLLYTVRIINSNCILEPTSSLWTRRGIESVGRVDF